LRALLGSRTLVVLALVLVAFSVMTATAVGKSADDGE